MRKNFLKVSMIVLAMLMLLTVLFAAMTINASAAVADDVAELRETITKAQTVYNGYGHLRYYTFTYSEYTDLRALITDANALVARYDNGETLESEEVRACIDGLIAGYTKFSAVVLFNASANGGKFEFSTATVEYYPIDADLNALVDLTDFVASKEGYEFIGWSTDVNGKSGVKDSITATGGTTLYAIYRKQAANATFKYYNSSGSVVSASIYGYIYNKDTEATYTLVTLLNDVNPYNLPVVNSKYYSFSGWRSDDAAEPAEYDKQAKTFVGAEGQTFYAVYTSGNASAAVATFDTKGGSAVASVTAYDYISAGGNRNTSLFVFTEEPTLEGFVFRGWATANNSDVVVYKTGDMVNSETSMTLYAVWECDHTGGTASCTVQAVCEKCGDSYGDLAAHNFLYGYLDHNDTHHWYACPDCNAPSENKVAHSLSSQKGSDASGHWDRCYLCYAAIGNIEAHNGNCTNDGVCSCGYVVAEEDRHNYINQIAQKNVTHHYTQVCEDCSMGNEESVAEHTDSDTNAICDACGGFTFPGTGTEADPYIVDTIYELNAAVNSTANATNYVKLGGEIVPGASFGAVVVDASTTPFVLDLDEYGITSDGKFHISTKATITGGSSMGLRITIYAISENADVLIYGVQRTLSLHVQDGALLTLTDCTNISELHTKGEGSKIVADNVATGLVSSGFYRCEGGTLVLDGVTYTESITDYHYPTAHIDENGDCVCDICPTLMHTDADANYLCEVCGSLFDANAFFDPDLWAYMLANFDADGNGALSPTEIASVTSIDLRGVNVVKISGIEHFTNLTELKCDIDMLWYTMSYDLSISGIDISKVTVESGAVIGDLNGKTVLLIDEGETTVVGTYALFEGGTPIALTLRILEPHTHKYEDVVWRDFVVTPATCTTGTVYYKSCECGKTNDETFEDTDLNPDNHDWNDTDVCSRCNAVKISEKTFPDPNFRDYLLNKLIPYGGFNDDVFTKEEIALITYLPQLGANMISDLTGIGYFTELTTLDCSSNWLKSIDLSKNTKLESVTLGSQSWVITIAPDATFDLNTLGIDLSLLTLPEGCTVNNGVIKLEAGVYELSGLTYPSGYGDTLFEVLLVIENPHTHASVEAFDDCTKQEVCLCGDITKAAKEHDFSGDYLHDADGHWHKCKDCGATDTKVKHSATEDGDCKTEEKCYCGAVVIAAKDEHGFDNACDTDCNNTGCTYTRTTSHVAEADDGDCSTAILCEHCDEEMTAAKTHSFDNNCDTTCNNGGCNHMRTAPHTPNADDGDCTTAVKCSVCQTVTTPANTTHTGGTATCQAQANCSVCGTAYGETNANNHSKTTFVYTANADGTTHTKKYECCGVVALNSEAHTYGADDKCVCGAVKPVPAYTVTVENGTVGEGNTSIVVNENGAVTVSADKAPEGKRFKGWSVNGEIVSTDETYTFHATEDIELKAVYEDVSSGSEDTPSAGDDTPPTGDTDVPPADPDNDEDALPGGAIAAIVISSAVVLGGGGFALWWLVFRKKKV